MIDGVFGEPAGGGGAWGGVNNSPVLPVNNANQVTVGEPVNPANGDVSHDETDFSIPNVQDSRATRPPSAR